MMRCHATQPPKALKPSETRPVGACRGKSTEGVTGTISPTLESAAHSGGEERSRFVEQVSQELEAITYMGDKTWRDLGGGSERS
jgi:hypothetical protein